MNHRPHLRHRSLLAPLLSAAGILLAACATPRTHVPAADPLGPYSAAVTAGGLVFVSGQVGRDRTDFAAEARAALGAVAAELARAGLDAGDLVSVTVFLTDIQRYAEFNTIYRELVPAPYPARACVAVTALPGGAAVEVQAIAAAR